MTQDPKTEYESPVRDPELRQTKRKIRRIERNPSTVKGMFSAWLIAPEQHARAQTAVVAVKAKGVKLVDPQETEPKQGEAYITYSLDSDEPIETDVTRMRFTGLEPGKHMIKVALVGPNGENIGSTQAIRVVIPDQG